MSSSRAGRLSACFTLCDSDNLHSSVGLSDHVSLALPCLALPRCRADSDDCCWDCRCTADAPASAVKHTAAVSVTEAAETSSVSLCRGWLTY
ncbi:hypothetical protein CALCODRAFT_493405 [Calocera cornea HHB12733]|uniref:Uncharacterized protein n=1 Tax=Calocera cornea HHB12733 TaxID=1353952 RepID=A0A165HSC2_9BASI|nr:hypothetical protein CALCODRAFT_493405 [Calocera cornea HHB12733]